MGFGRWHHTLSGAKVNHIYEAGGTFTATLTVTYDQGDKDSTALTITVLSDPDRVVYVYSIDLVLVAVPGGTAAEATVMVVDVNGSPRPGATVDGEWSSLVRGIVDGTTGSDGRVILASKKTKKSGTITFTVTGLFLSGYAYDSELNNQTRVSILKP